MKEISTFLSVFEVFLKVFYTHINPIISFKTWKGCKLRENHIKILMILTMVGEATPTFLSKALYIQKGSLTTLIRSLVNMDLIAKVVSKDNERSYKLKLTKEGKRFVAQSAKENLVLLSELLDSMSDDEMCSVITGFNTLNNCLERKSGTTL